MTKPLWTEVDGELWLDNPHLSILSANPKSRRSRKRSKKMARRLPKRNAKGRFVKGGARRRAARRVRVHTGRFGRKVRRVRVAKHPVLINPRRRRSASRRRYAYVSNPRRRAVRRYRRNPGGGGFMSIFSKPTLKNVGFAVVGLAGTPMLTGFIQKYLPANLTGNRFANYAIKGVSAYGLSLVANKVAGKDAGRAVLIGGLAYVTLGIITDFFPTLLGAGTGTGRYLQAQPLLAGVREYPFRGTGGAITSGAPSRLDPANRF